MKSQCHLFYLFVKNYLQIIVVINSPPPQIALGILSYFYGVKCNLTKSCKQVGYSVRKRDLISEYLSKKINLNQNSTTLSKYIEIFSEKFYNKDYICNYAQNLS